MITRAASCNCGQHTVVLEEIPTGSQSAAASRVSGGQAVFWSSGADNEIGWRMALDEVARFIEARMHE